MSIMQMEPTRPAMLCDPVTVARGSFATLGGLKEQHDQHVKCSS